jgi:prepilin-type N-terminal cleavage/methylation domain-containing protein
MLKKFFHFSNSAFTLIELLISIAIISLLFGVVLVNSNALRSSSGDAKRKADLAAIQSALQNYYADQNYYPRSAGNTATSGTAAFILHGATPTTTFSSSIGTGSTIPASIKTYLKTVPLDANTKFCYVAVDSAVTEAITAPPTCTNDRTTDPPGKLCNYYYLFTKLDNPDPNPPTVGALCGEAAGFFNYVINP